MLFLYITRFVLDTFSVVSTLMMRGAKTLATDVHRYVSPVSVIVQRIDAFKAEYGKGTNLKFTNILGYPVYWGPSQNL